QADASLQIHPQLFPLISDFSTKIFRPTSHCRLNPARANAVTVSHQVNRILEPGVFLTVDLGAVSAIGMDHDAHGHAFETFRQSRKWKSHRRGGEAGFFEKFSTRCES